MIFRIILWSIILTMVVRFIFRFLIPVVTVTRAAQSKLNEMQRQMEEMQRNQQQEQAPPLKKKPKIDGDYIDYEEV